jgi:hypothetical protein
VNPPRSEDCTNEVFLWPSITYQPHQLIRTMVGAKVWQKIPALADGEKEPYTPPPTPDHERLVSIQRGAQHTGSESA